MASQIASVLGLSEVRVSAGNSGPVQASVGLPALLQVTDRVARQLKRALVGRAVRAS